MNRLRPIVALTFLIALYAANIAEVLPGDSTGCAFSYSNEAKLFIGVSIILSLYQTLIRFRSYQTKQEAQTGKVFEWTIWSVAVIALIAFMLFQQNGADANRLIQLTMMVPVLIFCIPSKARRPIN